MEPTSLARLTCLCGMVAVSGNLLVDSELPIETGICHCSICRYTTGALGITLLSLTSAPPQETLSKLALYSSSQSQTRYFCPTCGCHCFLVQDQHWYCLGGLIERNPEIKADDIAWSKDISRVAHHDYVLDTKDGGLVPAFLKLNNRSVRTYAAASRSGSKDHTVSFPHSTVLSLPRKSAKDLSRPSQESFLKASCNCGGVSLLIKRANYDPNLRKGSSARFIPSDPTKYLTYLCACRSCRLSTGASLLAWTLVPPANVFNANKSVETDNIGKMVPVTFGSTALEPEANPNLTLKHNWSSPDVCRSFCGQCGATISYWNKQRPDELDLAVGIMRSEEGSLCRRWLEWVWGRCSFPEECIDQELCEAWLGCSERMPELEKANFEFEET